MMFEGVGATMFTHDDMRDYLHSHTHAILSIHLASEFSGRHYAVTDQPKDGAEDY